MPPSRRPRCSPRSGDQRVLTPARDRPAIVDTCTNSRFDHSGALAEELRNEFGRGLFFWLRTPEALLCRHAGGLPGSREKDHGPPAQGLLAGADTGMNSLPG